MKNYYDENSKEFIDDTIGCDMSEIYQLLMPYTANKQVLLDIGFGSGRDMVYFKSKGFNVYGIDTSEEMCKHAKLLGLDNVFQTDVLNMNFVDKFDVVWACASLLHVESPKLKQAFINCKKALKTKGVMYCSFKYGEFEGMRNERYFVDMTENKINEILTGTGFIIKNFIITEDVRENKETKWLNLILV